MGEKLVIDYSQSIHPNTQKLIDETLGNSNPKSVIQVKDDSTTCCVCGKKVENPNLSIEIKNYNKDGSSAKEVTCSTDCTEEYKNTRGI